MYLCPIRSFTTFHRCLVSICSQKPVQVFSILASHALVTNMSRLISFLLGPGSPLPPEESNLAKIQEQNFLNEFQLTYVGRQVENSLSSQQDVVRVILKISFLFASGKNCYQKYCYCSINILTVLQTFLCLKFLNRLLSTKDLQDLNSQQPCCLLPVSITTKSAKLDLEKCN